MPISYTQELSCEMCGKIFIFGNYEEELFDQQGFSKPKLCPVCRKTEQELREREIERIENEKWQQKKLEDKKAFNVLLNEWRVVSKDDIHFSNDHVLYVIGNGVSAEKGAV